VRRGAPSVACSSPRRTRAPPAPSRSGSGSDCAKGPSQPQSERLAVQATVQDPEARLHGRDGDRRHGRLRSGAGVGAPEHAEYAAVQLHRRGSHREASSSGGLRCLRGVPALVLRRVSAGRGSATSATGARPRMPCAALFMDVRLPARSLRSFHRTVPNLILVHPPIPRFAKILCRAHQHQEPPDSSG
jgi:hypothetical protein